MPLRKKYDEIELFKIFIKHDGVLTRFRNDPKAQIKALATLKTIADKHDWYARRRKILEQSTALTEKKIVTDMVDGKVEIYSKLDCIIDLFDRFFPSKDEDGNVIPAKIQPEKFIDLRILKDCLKLKFELQNDEIKILKVHDFGKVLMREMMRYVFDTIGELTFDDDTDEDRRKTLISQRMRDKIYQELRLNYSHEDVGLTIESIRDVLK